jgi:hypothetical protein
MLPSTLSTFVEDGRATVRSWKAYKIHTGQMPWLWIVVHLLNWATSISVMAFLMWFLFTKRLSRWQFLGTSLAIALPYGFLWLWIKNKVKLIHLRKQRRLARTRVQR